MAIYTLLKFGLREHMRQFREDGLLYSNPLSYFRSVELDVARSDPHEGVSVSYLASDVVCQIGEGRDAHFLSAETGLVGRVDIRIHEPEPNLFCMYALADDAFPPRIDERNFDFGDTAVVITNLDLFAERLTKAANDQDLQIQGELVEYVDADAHSGPIGVFRKLSPYAYQSEFRIAISPGQTFARRFVVGSLNDISIQVPLAEINARMKYEVRGIAAV